MEGRLQQYGDYLGAGGSGQGVPFDHGQMRFPSVDALRQAYSFLVEQLLTPTDLQLGIMECI